MSRRFNPGIVALCLALLAAPCAQAAQPDDPAKLAQKAQGFLKKFCAECHSGPCPKSDVEDYDVLNYASLTKKHGENNQAEHYVQAGLKGEAALKAAKVWSRAGVKGVAGAAADMPPRSAKTKPTDQERAELRAWLEAGAPAFDTPAVSTKPAADLALEVRTILKNNCAKCHGDKSMKKGDFGYVLDSAKLKSKTSSDGKAMIAAGKPDASFVLERLLNKSMPPASEKTQRPSPQDVDKVKAWIAAGAPDFPGDDTDLQRFAAADILQTIQKDLQAVDEEQRPFTRYFTLTYLPQDAQAAEKDVKKYGQGVSKLLNSLSWKKRIAVPELVAKSPPVWRIDLRDYGWEPKTWARVLADYPYAVWRDGDAASAVVAATYCELPYVRADWFLFAAAKPPLYYDLLHLPKTDQELEKFLGVDVPLNQKKGEAVRGGFPVSDVARFNRMIERHDTAFGAYWKGYDFADDANPRHNILSRPLGPDAADNRFAYEGGEIIFSLPNGLQAYYLSDSKGKRLDVAPTDITGDPGRPDKAIWNGISCMSCHYKGMNFKEDKVREHVLKNEQAFPEADRKLILKLYPPKAKFEARLTEDAQRFVAAVKATGDEISADRWTETITVLFQRFEAALPLSAAAAEVGLLKADFLKALDGLTPPLRDELGALKNEEVSISREKFSQLYEGLVRELKLGKSPQTRGELRRFGTVKTVAGALAFAPDGQRLLVGGADAVVRLYDVGSGRELRQFKGHTKAVFSLAFSPDGRLALSGGMDFTVKLWELDTGVLLRTFTGHKESVRGVAFLPDGKQFVSAGRDGKFKLWETDTGKEVWSKEAHYTGVQSMALSVDGTRILTGGRDGVVRLWKADSGTPLTNFQGHRDMVTGVAFAPDGGTFLSASGSADGSPGGLKGAPDRTLRLWNTQGGQRLVLNEPGEKEGHTAGILAAAYSADGKRVVTVSPDGTLVVWDPVLGDFVRRFHGHEGVVWTVALSPDGRRAVTGGADGTVRLWQLGR